VLVQVAQPTRIYQGDGEGGKHAPQTAGGRVPGAWRAAVVLVVVIFVYSLVEKALEQGGDQVFGVAAAGRGAGDQDPVPHRPGHLVDEHLGVEVAAQHFGVAGAPQPGLGQRIPGGEPGAHELACS